ncbi:phosphatase PAP2 family protein [Saccharopolyspora karakumensis]|uniref:Phosphatase PAP2 family protein n=1 Tax=Saccharopolyspora karakumensis TaxID=2530386 RepID=A0A4R5BRE5_9PSEU|nr:bifunctional phosphatase PAP2/diacylglycerol kinase family protein [Saccharopolyspora karakumensis]TDD88559.1 phosphatase PAP2 family protein [Saccharopolyspora karakumensis]
MLNSVRAIRRLKSADHHFVLRSASWPRSTADPALRRLSHLADHSKLWLGVAAVLATRRGRPRRAALRGASAIAFTSAVTNGIGKPLLPRRRPAANLLPVRRRLSTPPSSSSFPSGHAASAAAFTTAVWMESPAMGMALLPLAGAVAYSRVHTGVHWPTDVLFGAAIGTGVAAATSRWWPVRPTAPSIARPSARTVAMEEGDGLVLLVNPSSGDPARDPTAELAGLLPRADFVHPLPGVDLADQLHEHLDATGDAKALGVAGGDGSVAAAAAVAAVRGLPLLVVPSGTLNHFARDLGVNSTDDSVRALRAGSAVNVDLGTVKVDDVPQQWFVNTASLGGYPDMVRLREKWEHRWGKWPAGAAALVRVLASAEPIPVRINGIDRKIWLFFAGGNGYQPKGLAPTWRPRLDTGVLDVRYIRADLPFSRIRFVAGALTGALFHNRAYVQEERDRVRVEVLGAPVALARDGEVSLKGTVFEFAARDGALHVYRPD